MVQRHQGSSESGTSWPWSPMFPQAHFTPGPLKNGFKVEPRRLAMARSSICPRPDPPSAVFHWKYQLPHLRCGKTLPNRPLHIHRPQIFQINLTLRKFLPSHSASYAALPMVHLVVKGVNVPGYFLAGKSGKWRIQMGLECGRAVGTSVFFGVCPAFAAKPLAFIILAFVH